MISRILKSTANKPCSCPEGKICHGCKKKRILKPQVYLEEPRRLTVPIVISRYKHKEPSTTVQIIEKPRQWTIRKKETVNKQPTFCQWYKRRKALKELKADDRRERKQRRQEALDQARRDREIEFLQQLRLQAAAAATPVVEKKKFLEKPTPLPVVKKTKVVEKQKQYKARTATAKPRANTKSVYVKQYNRYDSLSNRFVNFCYRACCQCYCYLTCIFVIGFVIIYFI